MEDILTLDLLRLHDPNAPTPTSKLEWDFCCPLPACSGMAVNRVHRSLGVNQQTGTYHCHRCHGQGLLGEYRTKSQPMNRTAYAKKQLERYTNLAPYPEPVLVNDNLQQKLDNLQEVENTPAIAYLASRGITLDRGTKDIVKFSPSWHGKAAVVFLATDEHTEVVAAQGRLIAAAEGPNKISAGQIGSGFFVTPGVNTSDRVAVVEAPIDALSLYLCGMPAVALFGCGSAIQKNKLFSMLAWKSVYLAFDADEAGDIAAEDWSVFLPSCTVHRLRPANKKDWNEELLQYGKAATRMTIANMTQTAGACVFCDVATATHPESWEPECRTICGACFAKFR